MDGFRRALFKQTDSEGHFSNRLIQKDNFLMTEMEALIKYKNKKILLNKPKKIRLKI